MKYLSLWFAVLLLNTAVAQDTKDLIASDSLRVRAYTEPEQQVYVGQQLRLIIELMTDTWFNQAPAYPDLDLDGAIVLQPEQSGGNFSDREQGKTYSGVRHRYLIYPQRTGSFSVPVLKLDLAVAVDSKATPVTVMTNPVQFTAVMPEAAAQLEQFVTTTGLTVKQSYKPELEGLKVGDALTRHHYHESGKCAGAAVAGNSFSGACRTTGLSGTGQAQRPDRTRPLSQLQDRCSDVYSAAGR